MRRPLVLLICIAATASPLRSQELSLREAMARARTNARQVASAESRLAASRQALSEAKAYRLPRLQLQEVWLRTDSPAEAFALQLNQERFSFADFVSGDPNQPDAIENSLTRFEVSMPIYTGGEVSTRIRQAELAASAADATRGWSQDSAALAAAAAYIQLAEARENVELLQRSLATVTAHVQLARSYVEQGMLVGSELLRAQVEQARVEDMLTEAKGDAAVAESNLAFRLAMDQDSHFELAPLGEPRPVIHELDDWLGTAAHRADLGAAQSRVEAARLEAEAERAARLPKVGLVARYDLNDKSLFGSHGEAFALMAQASVDLFSGGRHRAAVAAAKEQANAAQEDLQEFSEGVALAVRRAYSAAVTARERHATAAAALDAARENERIVEQRFRQGIARTVDVLDAETARREAETRELTSRAEAHLALLELAVKAGREPESVLNGRDQP